MVIRSTEVERCGKYLVWFRRTYYRLSVVCFVYHNPWLVEVNKVERC
nr:hypothetical protein [uncultured Granulicatella sp.]